MNELELDSFLKQPMEIEKILLTLNSKGKNQMNIEDFSFNLQNKKMLPVTKSDMVDFFSNQSKHSLLPEDKLITPGQEIVFYTHPRYLNIESHHHGFIEMNYVYSGKCIQTISNEEVILKQGELCILDTNTFHSVKKVGKDDIIINCLMKKSYFDTAFLSRIATNDIFSNFFVHSIYQSKESKEFLVFHSESNEIIHRLMKMILCEYYDKKMCSNEIIDSYMIVLFAELLRIYRKDVNSQNLDDLKNTKVSDIIKYIQKNCREATLESTAKYFNFHPAYLSAIIKKLTGEGFIHILHEAKMNLASILLQTTDVPISAISNEVGYENITFFYRIFKKYFNTTPAKYRKFKQSK